MKMKRLSLTAFALAVALPPADAAVIVVAPPTGTPGLPLLQAAVAAAVPGDIVVVRAGDYYENPSVLLIDRGITVVRDSATPIQLRTVEVRSVPSGQHAVVRGIQIGPNSLSFFSTDYGLLVADCDGGVFVEDCVIDGTTGYGEFPFGPNVGEDALWIEGSAAVTLTRCTVTAGYSIDGIYLDINVPGAFGAVVKSSNVTFLDCVMQGASANFDGLGPDYEGGPGIAGQSGANVFVAGGTATGGSNIGGGIQEGIEATSNGVIRVRDVVATTSGITESYPTVMRSLAIDSPVASGSAATVAIDAAPNDHVFVLVGTGVANALSTTLEGVDVTSGAGTPAVLFLGTFGVNLGPTLGVPLPPLPPSVDGVTLLVQLATVRPTGCSLDGASSLVWIKAGL